MKLASRGVILQGSRALLSIVCAMCCLAFAADGSPVGAHPPLKTTDELTGSQSSASSAALLSPTPKLGTAVDYRIGPEDLLEVQVFGVDQLSRTVRVNSNGLVSMPLIGSVPLAGLTAQEAEGAIAEKLASQYMQDPQVSVFIKEYTTQRVTVEGAVKNPGVYPLRGDTTLLRTLAIAGGQGNLSDMSQVVVYRADASGARVGTTFDVERIRHGEVPDPMVLSDDVIVVNRSPLRTFLRDSAFRDALDAINPFAYLFPH
jgi:polysaccharide biosynthesis/export protein